MVYLQRGILLSYLNNEIMKFTDKLMELLGNLDMKKINCFVFVYMFILAIKSFPLFHVKSEVRYGVGDYR